MEKDKSVSPVLKWVGGKRQLLDTLATLLPKRVGAYCEPFVGGGALLFHLQPQSAYVNDVNHELVNVYEVIKRDVEALLAELAEHKNEPDWFYTVRNWDRDPAFYAGLSDVKRAARVLYLNKTCYNGLFRVNSAGEFNTPFGRYKRPNIVNEPGLRAVSRYFNSADIRITCRDYAEVLASVKKGTFVYLDPPYDPLSATAAFTGYAKGGFDKSEQLRLRDCCAALDARGIRFMLSNSATDFIKDIYAGFNITLVRAKRSVNSVSAKRGEVDEVVVRNYD